MMYKEIENRKLKEKEREKKIAINWIAIIVAMLLCILTGIGSVDAYETGDKIGDFEVLYDNTETIVEGDVEITSWSTRVDHDVYGYFVTGGYTQQPVEEAEVQLEEVVVEEIATEEVVGDTTPTTIIKGIDGIDGRDGRDGADGLDGQDGRDGIDGKDGRDGRDGLDGRDGKDGITHDIISERRENGVTTVKFINPVTGETVHEFDIHDGKDGKDGIDGIDGKDGIDGIDGRDGLDGRDGIDGKDGRDGLDKYIEVPTTEDITVDSLEELNTLENKEVLIEEPVEVVEVVVAEPQSAPVVITTTPVVEPEFVAEEAYEEAEEVVEEVVEEPVEVVEVVVAEPQSAMVALTLPNTGEETKKFGLLAVVLAITALLLLAPRKTEEE